jgi:hypothetical protein
MGADNPKRNGHTKAFLLELETRVQFGRPRVRSRLTVSQSAGNDGYGTSSKDAKSGGGSCAGMTGSVGGRVIIGESAVDVEACDAPAEGVDIAATNSNPTISPDVQGGHGGD